jgi:hypothetical protein
MFHIWPFMSGLGTLSLRGFMNLHVLRQFASFTALLASSMFAHAQGSDALTRDIATIKAKIFLGQRW